MNYAILFLLTVICAACAYRGIFGLFLWKWTRIPFAILGSFFLSIGMNGVPALPAREEEEDESIQPIEIKTPAEPGNPEDRWARQIFALKGRTPTDVKNEVVGLANSSFTPDPDFDEIEWLKEKEPWRDFVARRERERQRERGVA